MEGWQIGSASMVGMIGGGREVWVVKRKAEISSLVVRAGGIAATGVCGFGLPGPVVRCWPSGVEEESGFLGKVEDFWPSGCHIWLWSWPWWEKKGLGGWRVSKGK